MKKFIAALLLCTLGFVLLGCSATNAGQRDVDQLKNTNLDAHGKPLPYFEIDGIKLKIVEVQVFQPGKLPQEYNLVNENPVLAVTFEMSSHRDKAIEALFGFMSYASVTQESDSVVKTIDPATVSPSGELKKLASNQTEKVKRGGKIKSVAFYTVKYPGEPIHIDFKRNMFTRKVA